MDEHQSGVKLEEALEAKKELDAKAQKILEEKEADSRMRTYTGPLGRAVAVLLCVWTAFQLYFTTIGAISAVNLRAIHCIFLLVFTFLLFPTFKKEKRKRHLLKQIRQGKIIQGSIQPGAIHLLVHTLEKGGFML